jgi:hypothetical protein
MPEDQATSDKRQLNSLVRAAQPQGSGPFLLWLQEIDFLLFARKRRVVRNPPISGCGFHE